jgi:hypothetical protein
MKLSKLVLPLLPVFMTGCAVLGGALPADPFPAPPGIEFPAPAVMPDNAARLVLPASGGSPVLGLSLGGALYLPATGGPPVVGIPLTP